MLTYTLKVYQKIGPSHEEEAGHYPVDARDDAEAVCIAGQTYEATIAKAYQAVLIEGEGRRICDWGSPLA